MATDRLLKNTFIYFIGTMATRLLNLLMLPLYTKTIPTDGMGYYTFILSMLAVALPVLFFTIWDVYLRFGLDTSNDVEKQSVTSNVLLITAALMLVYLPVFLVVGSILKIEYLWPIALMAVTMPLAYIWQSGMRSSGENKAYAISGTAATVVNIIVSLVFILVLKLYVLSQYVSQAAAFLTIVIIGEFRTKLLIKVKISKFDWTIFKRMLKFGAPLLINTMAFWLINGANSFIIKAKLGDAANGVFSAASRFSMIIATLTQIIFYAWQEEAFREAKNENLQKYMSTILQNYNTVLFAGVCFGLPLLKVIYPLLVHGDYFVSWVYIPAVIMTAVYSALSAFSSTAFSTKMKTGAVMVTTIIGGSFSFLLSWFGIKQYGLQIVAVTSAIGFLITFLIRVALSKKLVPIKVNWLSFIGLNLAVALVTVIFYINSALLQLATSAAGLALFLVINRKLIGSVLGTIKKKFVKP